MIAIINSKWDLDQETWPLTAHLALDKLFVSLSAYHLQAEMRLGCWRQEGSRGKA